MTLQTTLLDPCSPLREHNPDIAQQGARARNQTRAALLISCLIAIALSLLAHHLLGAATVSANTWPFAASMLAVFSLFVGAWLALDSIRNASQLGEAELREVMAIAATYPALQPFVATWARRADS